MLDGYSCPECGSHVKSEDGREYECGECGTTYDSEDLFLP
jgi:tRNA(Ile2) C34 agmatinyltransferase TiaS